MNPTCRRLMRYRTPCPTLCRYCVTGLRDSLGPAGLKGRHPFGKGSRSDKRSNRRCYEGQTQTGGNRSAGARASAALKCAMPHCMVQRYCVTLGVPQLAVDMGGRPHKALVAGRTGISRRSCRVRTTHAGRWSRGVEKRICYFSRLSFSDMQQTRKGNFHYSGTDRRQASATDHDRRQA
jgi:hypothetical protein